MYRFRGMNNYDPSSSKFSPLPLGTLQNNGKKGKEKKKRKWHICFSFSLFFFSLLVANLNIHFGPNEIELWGRVGNLMG